ncbi:MAG: MoaE-MoaD fusion protein [Verrucomicrobiota bacterium]|jgi:molybdopterin converting factor subunit 1
MRVRVQFFSRLRDLAGVSDTEIEMPDNSTVGDLLELVYSRTEALREWEKSILVAAGVEFVDRNYVVQSGDEISIMPPVQGG